MPRFVIQEHYARSHHFDLRLAHNSVLLSWAVPKGMSTGPKKNRLASRVQDHALSRLNYTDDTPMGDAAKVSIWDRGTYTPHEFGESEIVVTLHGERVRGKHAIFWTRDKNWLVHRMDPPGNAVERDEG